MNFEIHPSVLFWNWKQRHGC